jgi:DNA primase
MAFPSTFLDEIKARLPMSEVARRKVKLVKAGREWKGLSPFNQEKTPSFYVNDQKQFFHDFSSGKHGSVFDFVMETEGLTFPEAVERLAKEVGLTPPISSPESERREKRRASLHEVLEWAVSHFEQELRGPRGVKARAYLAERQIAPALQQQFRLGYAGPDRYALRDFLAARGAGVELMIETGLLIHGEDIASPYDRFRNRVMFPITDRNGRTIAFGGRALDKNEAAKYVNSPETPLFHKGSILYNHHAARAAAHKAGAVVAVEGYVDVIALTGAGIGHVVAPLGTALTAEQAQLLWSMAEEPILCFDGDKAGRRAAEKAIDVALPLLAPGKSLRFAFLPDGMDPDDLARAGGRTALEETLAGAKPLVESLWTREVEAAPLDTPERRAALERRLLACVRDIQDETLRRYYREDLLGRLGALRAPSPRSASAPGRERAFVSTKGGPKAWRAFPPPARGYLASPPIISASLARSTTFVGHGSPPREASILVLLLNHPGLLSRYAEDLAGLEFSTRELLSFRDALIDLLHDEPPDADAARRALADRGLQSSLARIETAAPISAAWCVRPDADESDAYEVLRQALALHRRARALHKELLAAAAALGQDATDPNLARLREIQSELSGLDGREAVLDGFGASSERQAGV